MKRAILALMVVAAITAPAYADDDYNATLAGLIATSAQRGAEIGTICALEEARDIGHDLTPQQAYDHMWECVHSRLDGDNLGADTAINMVQEANKAALLGENP